MIKVFFSDLPKITNYKAKPYNSIRDGIRVYSKKMQITNNIEEAQIIFTVDIYIKDIIEKYKNDFYNNKKKLILIAVRDTLLNIECFKKYDKYIL